MNTNAIPHEAIAAADSGFWPMREGYVDSGGVPIYVKTIGAGRPLVALHGGPGATHDYLVHPLLPFANRRQLVFIDERGCGQSGRPKGSDEFAMDRLVSDVEAVRLALGLGRIDLVGHSFGGVLAQAYTAAHAQSVASLMLLGTASCVDRVESDLQRSLRSAPAELQSEIEALEARGIYGPDGAQLPRYRQCADAVLAPYMFASDVQPWDVDPIRFGWDAMRHVWGDRSEFRCTGTWRTLDLEPGMRAWSGPTLIVYGDHDFISDETAQHTHQLIQGSRLVRMEKAGHEMYVDKPAEFNEIVRSFLAELDQR